MVERPVREVRACAEQAQPRHNVRCTAGGRVDHHEEDAEEQQRRPQHDECCQRDRLRGPVQQRQAGADDEQINEVLRAKLDEQTERWGGKVTIVEIREDLLSAKEDEVVRESPCDIAVVKQRGAREIRRILVPVRGGPHAELALRFADAIAQQVAVSLNYLAAPGAPAGSVDEAFAEGVKNRASRREVIEAWRAMPSRPRAQRRRCSRMRPRLCASAC